MARTDGMNPPALSASIYWGVWVLAAVPVAALRDWWSWGAWLAAFLVFELGTKFARLERKHGRRYQLSTITTWLQRRLSKHDKFLRGWNAFVPGWLIALELFAGTRPLWQHYDRIAYVVFAVVTVFCFWNWLWDHLMHPQVNG